MRIAELLEQKGHDVETIAPDATVLRAIEILGEQHIGALVVSGDGLHLIGIVSERDIVRHLASRRAALLDDEVQTIMTSVVETCSPNDELDDLRAVMTDHRIRHVPVVESGELRGIVSIGDVVKSSIDLLTKDRDVLVDYITAR